jgi:hypothetical protein
MRIKEGVKTKGLKAAMDKPLEIYCLLCQCHGIEPVITDAVSERPKKSLHPLGYAVDLRMRDFKNPSSAALLLKKTLNDYDVIFYEKTKHVHIEYQLFLDMDKPSKTIIEGSADA